MVQSRMCCVFFFNIIFFFFFLSCGPTISKIRLHSACLQLLNFIACEIADNLFMTLSTLIVMLKAWIRCNIFEIVLRCSIKFIWQSFRIPVRTYSTEHIDSTRLDATQFGSTNWLSRPSSLLWLGTSCLAALNNS